MFSAVVGAPRPHLPAQRWVWGEQLCRQILTVQPALPAAALLSLSLWSPRPQPVGEPLQGVAERLPRRPHRCSSLTWTHVSWGDPACAWHRQQDSHPVSLRARVMGAATGLPECLVARSQPPFHSPRLRPGAPPSGFWPEFPKSISFTRCVESPRMC